MGEEVNDEDLERVAKGVRSIRRRELLARMVGAGVGAGLAGGLFGGSFLVLTEGAAERRDRRMGGRSHDWRTYIRVGLAIAGFAVGVALYRVLAPDALPEDVE